MYRLMVIASTVSSETATREYLAHGNNRHSKTPWIQELCQKVDAASGRLKQQNRRSDTERLIMNIAVALRTWNNKCLRWKHTLPFQDEIHEVYNSIYIFIVFYKHNYVLLYHVWGALMYDIYWLQASFKFQKCCNRIQSSGSMRLNRNVVNIWV